MIPSIVGSPYFSFGLMLVGVLYLIFVGEPQKGVQRHPWWPYIGWVSAGLFGLIVFSALEAGVISSFLIVERHLKPKNYQRIVEAAHKSANHFKRPIAVAAISTPEADAFAIEIMQALKEGGLPIFSISREVLIPNSMIALGTNVKGIFIQVFNVSNPPEEALILKGILENGKLNVGFYRNFDYGDLNYLLTIGLP